MVEADQSRLGQSTLGVDNIRINNNIINTGADTDILEGGARNNNRAQSARKILDHAHKTAEIEHKWLSRKASF